MQLPQSFKEFQTIYSPIHTCTLPEPYPVRTKSNPIDTEQIRFWYSPGKKEKEEWDNKWEFTGVAPEQGFLSDDSASDINAARL
nr:hypothetical protein [uncultured Bacteroides sp.]